MSLAQYVKCSLSAFLLSWFVILGIQGRAEDRPEKVVGAIVLGEKIYLPELNPSLVAEKQVQLTADEFAAWESEMRRRHLVSRVSHRVMLDWAKSNAVQPTREQIERHYEDETKQHLQDFATEPVGHRRVAFSVFMAVGHAVEWATAKALYEEYGGNIAVSSFGGIISIDGRNAQLKEYASAGKIRFTDSAIEREFWQGVRDPGVLDVTIRDPDRIAQCFATAPWIGWGERTAKRLREELGTREANNAR